MSALIKFVVVMVEGEQFCSVENNFFRSFEMSIAWRLINLVKRVESAFPAFTSDYGLSRAAAACAVNRHWTSGLHIQIRKFTQDTRSHLANKKLKVNEYRSWSVLSHKCPGIEVKYYYTDGETRAATASAAIAAALNKCVRLNAIARWSIRNRFRKRELWLWD